jgi:hypothetical protein
MKIKHYFDDFFLLKIRLSPAAYLKPSKINVVTESRSDSCSDHHQNLCFTPITQRSDKVKTAHSRWRD